jgi:hypothetical protein
MSELGERRLARRTSASAFVGHLLPRDARQRRWAWIPADREAKGCVTASMDARLTCRTVALTARARRAVDAEVVVVAEALALVSHDLRAGAPERRRGGVTNRLPETEVACARPADGRGEGRRLKAGQDRGRPGYGSAGTDPLEHPPTGNAVLGDFDVRLLWIHDHPLRTPAKQCRA